MEDVDRPPAVVRLRLRDVPVMAGVAASAFACRRHTRRWPQLWKAWFACAAAIQFASHGGWCTSSRSAVVSTATIGQRVGLRLVAVTAAIVTLLSTIGLVFLIVWWPLGVALTCLLFAVAAVGMADLHRRRPLTRLRRRDSVWVTWLSSAKPGHGRAVLAALCQWADTKNHTLCLETKDGTLVSYYATFGFEQIGQPLLLGSSTLVHLARPPMSTAGCHLAGRTSSHET